MNILLWTLAVASGACALATTGAKRSKLFPELPAIAETLPGYEIAQWVGLLAPANTPKDIIAAWHAAIVKAVATPRVTQQFMAAGSQPIANSPEEFAAHIKTEIAKWECVTRGFKVALD